MMIMIIIIIIIIISISNTMIMRGLVTSMYSRIWNSENGKPTK